MCFILNTLGAFSQDMEGADPTYSDGIRHREYILNVTPLIAQLVPFNGSTLTNDNWFDFQSRRLKNGKGYRFGLGMNINGNNSRTELEFVYLRFGYVKKNQLTKYFHLARSFDFNLLAENRDNVRPVNRKADFSGVGISYSVGIEYNFNQHISISTEGSLFLGLLPEARSNTKLRFVPPVGLFFHLRL